MFLVRPALRLAAVVLSSVALSLPAAAADPGSRGCDTCRVLSEKALSLDLAQAIAQGAPAKCRADGNHVTITVVDRDGLAKFAFRDDGASPHTLTTSRRKVFTP
jgi:lipoate synthase